MQALRQYRECTSTWSHYISEQAGSTTEVAEGVGAE